MERTEPVFPLEIFEHIISALGNETHEWARKAVKACALSSRAFLPRCRSHIFETVKILPPYSRSDYMANSPSIALEPFIRLLDGNPNLAFYIRTFHYCVQSADFNNAVLVVALRQLNRVQRLFLSSRTGYHRILLAWNAVPEDLRLALEAIVRSPFLRDLHLTTITNFPASLLVSAINLQCLSLHSSDISLSSSPEWAPLHPLSLTSLTIRGTTSLNSIRLLDERNKNGYPMVDLSGLLDFTIFRPELQSDEVPDELLAAAEMVQLSNSIECLTCTVRDTGRSTSFKSFLDYNVLKTLKTFKAYIWISQYIDGAHTHFFGLWEELERWAGKNLLEEIDIVILCDYSFFLCEGALKNLDILAVEKNFPELGEVTIKMQVIDPGEVGHTFYSKSSQKQMQEAASLKLNASNRIHFRYTSHLVRDFVLPYDGDD